jgi:hypothetical protein
MEWWHEDPELLSATLEMLAATEEDLHAPTPTPVNTAVSSASPSVQALTSPSSSSPSSPSKDVETLVDNSKRKQPSRQRGRAKVINVSRERRRDETRYLRGKVAELEAQLSILQHRREQMLRPHLTETGEIRSIAAVWEEVATRQVREVKRSRLVNDRLKTMVENQLRVAGDLMTAIREAEAACQRQRDESDGMLQFSRPRLAIDISQKISEEQQLERLEMMCGQWREAFLRTPRFSDGKSLRFFDMQLVEDDGVDAVVDVFSSWALPFPRDAVEDVFWKFFLEDYDDDGDGASFAQDYVSKDDTLVGIFRALSTVESHRIKFEGKFVGKRMRCSEGHMMVVMHMYSEPRCKSNRMDNVTMNEDSWSRVVDSQAVGGPALSYPLTLIQHVRRMYIHFGSDAQQAPDAIAERPPGALTEFMMLQVEDEMMRSEQCIESALLNDFGKLTFGAEPPAKEGRTVVV